MLPWRNSARPPHCGGKRGVSNTPRKMRRNKKHNLYETANAVVDFLVFPSFTRAVSRCGLLALLGLGNRILYNGKIPLAAITPRSYGGFFSIVIMILKVNLHGRDFYAPYMSTTLTAKSFSAVVRVGVRAGFWYAKDVKGNHSATLLSRPRPQTLA